MDGWKSVNIHLRNGVVRTPVDGQGKVGSCTFSPLYKKWSYGPLLTTSRGCGEYIGPNEPSILLRGVGMAEWRYKYKKKSLHLEGLFYPSYPWKKGIYTGYKSIWLPSWPLKKGQKQGGPISSEVHL